MNAERLLAYYERLADAPDAIARLRRFTLDLAVRGKLVPQNPNDEPASDLLKQIAAEKARLEKQRTITNSSVFDDVSSDDFPFDLPNSWQWVELTDILTKLTDGTHHSPPNGPSGDFKYITAKNIKDEGVSLSDVTYVSRQVHDEIYLRCNPEKGDVLYIKDGATTGVVTINNLDEPFSMLSSVALLKLTRCVFNRLIVVFLRSPFFYDQMRGFMKGAAITRVTLKRMSPALLPLPPLAEQHRIVAKVDELMTLCDRLEAARAEREATRDRLTAASLARLNAPDPETFRDDASFALDVLPALTGRADQIKQVRQTILNLAMRGKFVPRDIAAPTKDVELESLVKIVRGSSPRPKGDPRYYGGPVPRLLIADITRDGKYVTPQLDSLTVEGGKLSRPMPKGSLVLAISGSYGVPAFLAVDACIHDGFIGFRDVSPLVDPDYLYLVMQFRRPYFDEVVKDSGLKNLTTDHLKRMLVPLFGLDLQRRIVAKVNELMALCDQLEASLTVADDTRRRLLDALLAEALAGGEDDATQLDKEVLASDAA
jgi:type I restriction enzyme S subunit